MPYEGNHEKSSHNVYEYFLEWTEGKSTPDSPNVAAVDYQRGH
jgi:hypothetical protein